MVVSDTPVIYLERLRQNPLTEGELDISVIRRDPLSHIFQNVLFYESGCYLLSGQRGSGKTTLSNQLAYYLRNLEEQSVREQIAHILEIDPDLLPEELIPLVVKIDIAKHYDELALLERILRRLTEEFLDVYQSENELSKRLRAKLSRNQEKWLISYVNDCRDLLDTRRGLSVEQALTKTTLFGISVAAQYESELNAILKKDAISLELVPEISRQVERAIQNSISWESKDYTVEAIETRLFNLLECLSDTSFIERIHRRRVAAVLSYSDIEVAVNEAFKRETLGDRLEDIREKVVRAGKQAWRTLLGSDNKEGHHARLFDKILVVVDDTDKVGYADSVRVLNNLRGLFQNANAYFLFVGSEDFYEEWYSYNAPGTRAEIDSVFHDVYYLPVLSVGDARSFLGKLVSHHSSYPADIEIKLDWYAEILLFISQGLPRQLNRALDLLGVKLGDSGLRLDFSIFDFFSAASPRQIIRRFLDVYTNYQDPRYEKCLYVALMMLSSVDNMSVGALKTALEKDELTRYYSPMIRNRVVKDVTSIVPFEEASALEYGFRPAAHIFLRSSKDSLYQSLGTVLQEYSAIGQSTISGQDLDMFFAVHGVKPADSNRHIKRLLSDRVLSPRDNKDRQRVSLGDFSFVIGPREIDGLRSGRITFQQMVSEQRSGGLRLAAETISFRRHLIEG